MIQEKIFGLVLFVSVVLFSDIDTFRVSNYFKDFQAQSGNSDTYLTPVQIIKNNGYPAESHIVQSKDGYFLELHRIPHRKLNSRKNIPILLHHGLLCSSIDWIVNGPNKSLAYRLSDEGYDVWMANARGNTFSRRHVKYSPTQKEFWNFSFHEMGVYDLPAVIDHILETTEVKQLVYVGHSLGTTIFFAMASSLPEYNKKIKFQVSLAPVGAIPHSTSSLRILVPFIKTIVDMSEWYDHGSYLAHGLLNKFFMEMLCGSKASSIGTSICKSSIIFSLFGEDSAQFNTSLLPVLASNLPAGTSGKNMIHCAQLISSGTLSHFDYGKAENIIKYGMAVPPEYNLANINVPIKFYYGENDLIGPPLDTKLLYQKFRKPLGLVRINWDEFNHVDFLWAKDLNKLLNDELVEFIKKATDYYTGFDFVQNTIIQALDIRNSTPSPVNVPFHQADFLITLTKSWPKNVNEIVTYFKKLIGEPVTQQSTNVWNAAKNKCKELVNKVKNWFSFT